MKYVSISKMWLIVYAMVVSLACTAIVFLAQPPRRWHEQLMELNKTQIHALLGVPDVDFSEKGWEGWDQPAFWGAWVLKVRYGENDRVSSVQRKFDWGFSYLFWDRDYFRRLPRGSLGSSLAA